MRCCGSVWWRLLLAVALLAATDAGAVDQRIDDFEDLSAWTATASPGATAEIARDEGADGQAMRVDFDLGMGGFVIVRRPVSIALPANYVFSFRVRGDAPPNNLELKLVDPKGDDVWWAIERDFEFPRDWERVTVRRSRLKYAWGSSGGKPLARVGFIEIAITAGSGGKGSVWFDDLVFEPRPTRAPKPPRPEVTASTSAPGHAPDAALDGDLRTTWKSGAVAEQQWLSIDLVEPREFGGLIIDWDPDDYPTSYRVELSDDGKTWTERYRSETGTGRRSYVYLHDAEARFIRLVLELSSRGQGYGVRRLRIEPLSFSSTPNDFFAAIAREALPGFYPKYLLGRQSYWTVVGVAGDSDEALINEEGTIEVGKSQFSIEPFLFADGRLVTWNDVATAQRLERGDLPIPSVTWSTDSLVLDVSPIATGAPGESTLFVRYRVTNRAAERRDVLLFVAVRPFQVLPSWQSLNMIGGATRIRSLASVERTVVVNDARTVVSLTPPERFGAASFEDDLVTNYLAQGRVPSRGTVHDPFGYAAGAFEYRLPLEPGASADVIVAAPFHGNAEIASQPVDDPPALYDRERAAAIAAWERELDRVEYGVPESAQDLVRAVRSTLAYIEINRDGPAIQPGSRTYARSWIRDGAFTSGALLDAGHTEEVREFLRWYARFQFPDGRIPCCIDRRGADRVPEHDSDGEFVFTLAEYYRYTRDVGFVYELWPNVVRAVESIAALRAQRLTPEYDEEERLHYRGLLPESISHEGYSAHPVHAYWDGFFALRGLKDAAMLARVVADDERAKSFAELRDAFRTDLYASIARTIEKHRIAFLPGSADLGDFDATSTAAAITPVGELANLPPGPLAQTFDQYLEYVRQRSTRPPGEEGYTPYEFRNVSALIEMGRREDAWWLLDVLMADQRPAAWNQWAEVVWRDPALPRFIGDMPHTWVGASFLRAVRTMFAYERERDGALVLGGGLPAAWILDGPGASVARLPTHHGVLTYSVRRDGDAVVFEIAGDLDVPAGGLVLDPPLPAPVVSLTVNGEAQAVEGDGTVRVRAVPAVVRVAWGDGAGADAGVDSDPGAGGDARAGADAAAAVGGDAAPGSGAKAASR